MLQIVFCHKHLKYLPMHPFIFSVNKKVFLKCKVFIQPFLEYHKWCFSDVYIDEFSWPWRVLVGYDTQNLRTYFFFLYLILVRPLLALSHSVSQFLESCKELGKDPRRNNKKIIKKDGGKDLWGKVEDTELASLENCRPRTDLIAFLENRKVYLEEDTSWLFSISIEMKTRQNWIRMNKRDLFDLRQNSTAKVIKLCHYHHWRALKICWTTISYV